MQPVRAESPIWFRAHDRDVAAVDTNSAPTRGAARASRPSAIPAGSGDEIATTRIVDDQRGKSMPTGIRYET